jgi:hypothetical protein
MRMAHSHKIYITFSFSNTPGNTTYMPIYVKQTLTSGFLVPESPEVLENHIGWLVAFLKQDPWN